MHTQKLLILAKHRNLRILGYHVASVIHSEIYSDHGKRANMVDGFFSRLRKMVRGQHQDVSPLHLY